MKEFRLLDWLMSGALIGIVAIITLIWRLDSTVALQAEKIANIEVMNRNYVTKEKFDAAFQIMEIKIGAKYDPRIQELERRTNKLEK